MVFPDDSSHFKNWLFTKEQLQDIRKRVYEEARGRLQEKIDELDIKDIDASAFPNQLETHELVQYFVAQLLYVCSEKHLEYRVTITAATFLIRFYLKRNILEHDPRRILLTCILLAVKVEESNHVTVRHFCEGLILNKNKLAEVLDSELIVLDALNFHLFVLNSRAPISYLTTEYYQQNKNSCKDNVHNTKLQQKLNDINRECENLIFKVITDCNDLILTYTPAQIGTAAFFQIASVNFPDASEFVLKQYIRMSQMNEIACFGEKEFDCDKVLNSLQAICTELTLTIEYQSKFTPIERSKRALKIIKKTEKIQKLIYKSKKARTGTV